MFALHHVSDVDFIFQNRCDGVDCPCPDFAAFLIVRNEALAAVADLEIARRHNLHRVQTLCNRICGHSALIPVKDLPHDFRLLFVHHELVMICRVFLIAERRIVSGKFAAFALHG